MALFWWWPFGRVPEIAPGELARMREYAAAVLAIMLLNLVTVLVVERIVPVLTALRALEVL